MLDLLTDFEPVDLYLGWMRLRLDDAAFLVGFFRACVKTPVEYYEPPELTADLVQRLSLDLTKLIDEYALAHRWFADELAAERGFAIEEAIAACATFIEHNQAAA